MRIKIVVVIPNGIITAPFRHHSFGFGYYGMKFVFDETLAHVHIKKHAVLNDAGTHTAH